MNQSNDQLVDLIAGAEQAYRRARTEVFDQLAPGTRVEMDALTPIQRDAFEDLVIAEAELANCRFQRYGRHSERLSEPTSR